VKTYLELLRSCQAMNGQRLAKSTLLLMLALTLAGSEGCKREDHSSLPIRPKAFLKPKKEALSLLGYPSQWIGSKTLTVAPGVHVLGELHPSAVFAIETKLGVVLIDSGVDEECGQLHESLISVGIHFSKISHVLITHAHYDHVFGVNKIRALTNAVVCAGSEDCKALGEADEDALFSLFPHHQYTGGKIKVDRELKDGDILDFGDASIEVIKCAGHTPGSVCYLLTKDNQRVLFSGDVIASLNFGPATYPVHISPSFRGDAGDYLNTVNRLLEIEAPDLLLTGHPLQQTRLQSIRMNEQSWHDLLDPARIELEEVVRQHRDDGADFLDATPKKIENNLFYLGMLDGIAVYAIDDGESIVAVNAPGGNRFANFFTTQRGLLGLVPSEPTIVLLTSNADNHCSGLVSLRDAPIVVASGLAVDAIANAGIERVRSEESLSELFSFAIEPTRLHLPPNESLGYTFTVGSKQVLVTPAVPRNISIVWTNRQSGRATRSPLQPQTLELAEALQSPNTFADSYQQAVQQLQKFSPNIWLPSVPLSGQNANLYGDRWSIIVDSNLDLARAVRNAE